MRQLTQNKVRALEESKPQEKYYIGKKRYIPDECDLLCRFFTPPPDKKGFWGCLASIEESLYRTSKGVFFTVKKGETTEVALLTEKEAFCFMDKHAAGIDTETYNKVFGEPEKG